MPAACLHAQLVQKVVNKAPNLCRFLEEEAEEMSRLHREHAAEAKAKREQQIERERMVCLALQASLFLPTLQPYPSCKADGS